MNGTIPFPNFFFRAFHSGTVPVEVPQRMVQDALKRMDNITGTGDNIEEINRFPREKFSCEIVKETKALGSASGITVLVETDTGTRRGATKTYLSKAECSACQPLVVKELTQKKCRKMRRLQWVGIYGKVEE